MSFYERYKCDRNGGIHAPYLLRRSWHCSACKEITHWAGHRCRQCRRRVCCGCFDHASAICQPEVKDCADVLFARARKIVQPYIDRTIDAENVDNETLDLLLRAQGVDLEKLKEKTLECVRRLKNDMRERSEAARVDLDTFTEPLTPRLPRQDRYEDYLL